VIDLSNQMIYRISNLDVQNERISYQMSTGKVLQNGSDDSVLYARYLNIENKLRDSEGLKTQIDKTVAQNNVADDVVNEVKDTLDDIKQDLLKSLNSGMTRNDMLAVATNVSGMRDNLMRLANTQIDGEYIFAGSNTTVMPYEKDSDFIINGQVNFNGNSHLRNIAVDPGIYRERGVPASDIFMYNTDTTAVDNTLSFSKNEMVIDQNGYTWKLNTNAVFDPKLEKLNQDGTVSEEYLEVKSDGSVTFHETDLIGGTWQFIDYSDSDSDGDPLTGVTKDRVYKMAADGVTPTAEYRYVTNVGTDSGGTIYKTLDGNDPAIYTTEDITTATNIKSNTQSGLLLEAKKNVFDDLNIIVNALNGYSTVQTDTANFGEKETLLGDTQVRDLLSNYLGKVDQQYNATNIGHAELGGRNKVFETYLESISTKVTHYNILIQETNGADLAKLSMESKALEMTYSALFSTVAKMSQLSLVNYIK